MEFSKKDIYDKKIKEHVKQILLICEQERLPVFMTFAVSDTGSETTYVNEMVSAGAAGIELSNDQLYNHVLVTNGFRVLPPVKNVLDIEEEMEVLE